MTDAHQVRSLNLAAAELRARELDAGDELAGFRERFFIPRDAGGGEAVYLCGNSLGLQPRAAREIVLGELDDWAEMAVEGHFRGRRPWFPYHERLREPGARLVGALPHEVVFMNGLTVNLHLLMATFFRPTPQRFKILIESPAFPSDTYAVQTQLRCQGLDPAERFSSRPRAGEQTLRSEDLLALIEREGPRLALLLLGGVNYFTGQLLDIEEITRAVHRQGAIAAWDLAHAAGNVELRLHDWNIDFAAWCTYKYLNSGPGAVAGAFVHERHVRNTALPRLGGWWGNDPSTRFRMHLEERFEPVPSADAWQLSNPPILSMAPLVASLALFDEAGMPALRRKSLALTRFTRELIDAIDSPSRPGYTIITPQPDAQHGAQLSILVHGDGRGLHRALEAGGVMCDFREPNVVRIAPAPLYNSFHDVWRFVRVLAAV